MPWLASKCGIRISAVSHPTYSRDRKMRVGCLFIRSFRSAFTPSSILHDIFVLSPTAWFFRLSGPSSLLGRGPLSYRRSAPSGYSFLSGLPNEPCQSHCRFLRASSRRAEVHSLRPLTLFPFLCINEIKLVLFHGFA